MKSSEEPVSCNNNNHHLLDMLRAFYTLIIKPHIYWVLANVAGAVLSTF